MIFFLVLSLSQLLGNEAHAEKEVAFRTPAKIYGSSYSIKMTMTRDGFTYDVPVWVKPDQITSTLDRELMADLGWTYPDVKPEDISVSEEPLELVKFKNQKSEWAYVPDFSKSCCYGIIGQDILADFEVRFDPNPPAHLEWTRVVGEGKKAKPSAKFQKELEALFSVHKTVNTFAGKKIELARTAYRLNLQKNELVFDPEWVNPKSAAKPLKANLFQYEFVPPKRDIRVTALPREFLKSAKAVGFRPSMKIVSINNVVVAKLDHFELDDFLRGYRSKVLVIKTDKNSYTFDFEKNEFTESEPLQSMPSRK